MVLIATGAAAAADPSSGHAAAVVTPTGVTETIRIEIVNGRLKFVAPPTVSQGDELEIVNETNPKQVGPHTFSLVNRGALPKTGSARRNCSAARHICLSIAGWHGFDAREEVTVDPAEAGPDGWSTMGSTSRQGDSWFSGFDRNARFSQLVSASAPTTLYFMCAIHPWMQGRMQVLAPATPSRFPVVQPRARG